MFNSHRVLAGFLPDGPLGLDYENYAEVLPTTAIHGDIETLDILTRIRPSTTDIGITERERSEAWEVAEYRCDWKEMWVRKVLRNPDGDPDAWYAAFEDMMADFTLGESTSTGETLYRRATSTVPREDGVCIDEESDTEAEDQGRWEDALEEPIEAERGQHAAPSQH